MGLVRAVSLETRSQTSTEQPVDVPYNIDMFSQAAGLVANTYCKHAADERGLKVGDATLLASIGHGELRQRVNFFHSDSLGIAVAIMGTNTSNGFSILHDAQFRQVDPDERFAAYLPKGVKLMNGFQKAYVDLVDDIFRNVKKFKKSKNENRVTVIGHSLGAAMGLLAAVDVEKRMDGGLYKAYLFGLPRLGNPVFASYVDRTIGKKLRWAINGRDGVPTLPPREFGYQHPSNYVWIYPGNTTQWKLYPGQENVHGLPTAHPIIGSYDHTGVYFHTQIGGRAIEADVTCPATVGTD